MRITAADMTGEQLRAYYGQPESADLTLVLSLLGNPDTGTDVAALCAFRYPSSEACQAFADGNK
jgi:hypothetical protein